MSLIAIWSPLVTMLLSKFFSTMKIVSVILYTLLCLSVSAQGRSATLQLYTHGPTALKTYLGLIAGAKKSIELESFVFVPDRVGQLVLQALKEKALVQVHVRVLMDAYGSQKYFSSSLLNDLLASGIEIRFYNAKRWHPLPIDHRKFLIVDGATTLFGGRNLSEENFGVDPVKRRLDYSLVINGEVVPKIQKSFESYWTSPMVTAVRQTGVGHFVFSSEALQLKKQLSEMPDVLAGEFHPSKIMFVSDEPTNKKRLFVDELIKHLGLVQNQVVIETPDFATGRRLSTALNELLHTHKIVSLLTTDAADHSATLSYSVLSLWSYQSSQNMKNAGVNVFFKQAALSPEVLPLLDPAPKSVPWGSHCKVTVFDEKDVLFGSFNYDLLSEEHNSEAGIYFLDSPELALALRKIEASRPYRKL